MTFDYILRFDISGYSWFFFGFTIGHYLLGINLIYKKIFKFKNNEATKNKSTYNENREQFIAEYDRCNPITQKSASQEYLRFMKSIQLY